MGLELATSTKWLGFVLDTADMSITLPKDKLSEVIDDCKQWAGKKTASRKQIQSLTGTLQHITKCIKPAARFTNRVLAVLRATSYKGQHSFDKDLLLDLSWFEKFAHKYNGVQLLPSGSRKEWVLECDSTLQGRVAFSQTKFYGITYNQNILPKGLSIVHLEALNLALALKTLLLQNPHDYCITVNTDKTSQQVLEVGRGRDPLRGPGATRLLTSIFI